MDASEPIDLLPDSGDPGVFGEISGGMLTRGVLGAETAYLPDVVAEEAVTLSTTAFHDDPFGIDASQRHWGGALSPETIVFIDGGLADLETLLAGVVPGVEAIVLDPSEDAIAQITETLAGRTHIHSLQLISHGRPGQLQIGQTRLDAETLTQYQSQVQRWANALTADADILLYGCNLAADASGIQLIEALGQLTGADIAASSDLTGSRVLGGDWDLEVVTGSIESNLGLYLWAQSAYDAILATVTDLQVNSASYLGGTGDDTAVAVEIAPNNTVLVAGTIDNRGQISRLDATGQTVLATYTVGSTVTDMDVNRVTGNITAVGNDGVTTLNPDGTVVWTAALTGPTTRRVAVAADGAIAVLETNQSYNNKITVFSASGTQLGSFTLNGDKSVEDIAIDSNSGSVFLAGYRQAASDLQLPLFRSYDYAGSLKWSNYEFSALEAKNAGDTADTRGLRVTMGRDGMLYYAGSLDGGTTVYRRNPRDISQNAAHNVNIDNYTNTSNTSAGKYGYFGRFNPATGQALKGQYVVNRLSSGKGNSFNVNAIAADESGQVFIGGSAAYAVPNREALKINNTAAGNYTMGEGAVIAVSADFSSRELVAVWSGTGTVAASGVNGVAAAAGLRAIASTTSGSMVTVNAVQSTLAGGNDAYFSVWGNSTLPTLAVNDISVTEGDSGSLNAVFTISLSHAPASNVTVNYTTADDTARAGSDYTATAGTLTFTPTGALTQTVAVPILGDSVKEVLERFSLNLSGVNENAAIADSQGIASIVDNDSNAPTNISLSNLSVPENSAGETVIGTFSTTDIDVGDTHTYTLLNDAGGRFKVVGNELRVANSALLNFEANPNHTLQICTTDAAGLTFDKILTIALTDVNEIPLVTKPEDIAITDVTATPQSKVNLATIFSDLDAGDTLTYRIVSNSNSTLFRNPPLLDARTGELILNYAQNATGTSEITVRATDNLGLAVETTFKVMVQAKATVSSPTLVIATKATEAIASSEVTAASTLADNFAPRENNNPNLQSFDELGRDRGNSKEDSTLLDIPGLQMQQSPQKLSFNHLSVVLPIQVNSPTQSDSNILNNRPQSILPTWAVIPASKPLNLESLVPFDDVETAIFANPKQSLAFADKAAIAFTKTSPLLATVEDSSENTILAQLFSRFRVSDLDKFNGVALATAAFLLTGTLGTYNTTALPKAAIKSKKPPQRNDDDIDNNADRRQEFAGREINEQEEDELPLLFEDSERIVFRG
jgi:ribosomal protein S5